MSSKTEFPTPILVRRDADHSEGRWLHVNSCLLHRPAGRRSAPALLAIGGFAAKRTARLAMAGHTGASEMYEVRSVGWVDPRPNWASR
jgi:hypothetical protein